MSSDEVSAAKTDTPKSPWLRRRLRQLWREILKPFLVVFLVLGTFRSAVADWYYVPTGSMKPTILEGDRILVNKLAYGLRFPLLGTWILDWNGPIRGEVVVFVPPDSKDFYVKRVVGLPGDLVELRENHLFVNGEPVKYGLIDPKIVDQLPADIREEYQFASEELGDRVHPVMTQGTGTLQSSFEPLRVPEGKYFVMGDNRDNSRDSRWFGVVPRERIVGRAVRVLVSTDMGNVLLPRWQRFMHDLP